MPVRFYECANGEAALLGERSDPSPQTVLADAARWSCDRLERRFAATATLPDGSLLRGLAGVRTRSCARRFGLDVPASARPGSTADVRVIDRFGLGGTRVRVCARRCRALTFPPAVTIRSVKVVVGRQVTVRTPYGTTRRRISAGGGDGARAECPRDRRLPDDRRGELPRGRTR